MKIHMKHLDLLVILFHPRGRILGRFFALFWTFFRKSRYGCLHSKMKVLFKIHREGVVNLEKVPKKTRKIPMLFEIKTVFGGLVRFWKFGANFVGFLDLDFVDFRSSDF